MEAVFQCRGLCLNFGELKAVDQVSFSVAPGELLGIIGPNGAGKTSLFNLISGVMRPSAGEARFQGRNLIGLPPHQIARMGLARTFQIVKPFRGMTVRENVAVGIIYVRRFPVKEAVREADGILEMIGLAGKAGELAAQLSLPHMKRLELAKALGTGPKLLLLDEIMAGLNPTEVQEVMEVVQGINRRGVTILMIEHVMRAVMGISHRVLVLHQGRNLTVGKPEEVANHPEVIEAYLGTKHTHH